MRRRPLPLAAAALSLVLALIVLPLQAARPRYGAVDTITAGDLRMHLEFLASPDMRGRETPSQELDVAARYIAAQLARLGFTPGGTHGFLQPYTVVRERSDPAASTVKVGDRTFRAGPDFIAGARAIRASGQIVYAGRGWSRLDGAEDPFGGLPVKGRIVVAHASTPKDLRDLEKVPAEWKQWRSPARSAAQAGALAVVFLPTARQLESWGVREPAVQTERVYVEGLVPDSTEPEGVPAIMASPALVSAIFDGQDVSAAELLARELRHDPGPAFALKGSTTLDLSLVTAFDRVEANNVVARLEGADPVLRRDHVLLSAHYDHVGVRGASGFDDRFTRVPPEAIYAGADDNGSGSVGLIEIAEALARGPRPRRSVAFVWHSGEERGLWGSRWYSEHPTIPLDGVIANLNADMIGRSRPAGSDPSGTLTAPREVHVIGARRATPALGALIARVNGEYQKLTLNYSLDAPNEPLNLYERSDHFIYAKKGIPVAFFFTGLHRDYHQTTDTIEKIDFAKLEAVTRTIHAVAWTLGEQGLAGRGGGGK